MSDPLSALRAVSGGQEPSTGEAGLPNIPQVPMTADAAVNNILSSMKLWMEKAVDAGKATGFATRQELLRAGVITTDENGVIVSPSGPLNLSIPPTPTGLTAQGAMTNILVEWDSPAGAYANHGYAEVWAAESNNFSIAVMVGQAGGFVYSHAVGEDATRYYWIRFVSTAGVKGPFNGVNGAKGNTVKNPAYLLETLSGQIRSSELEATLNSRISLIDAPATTPGSVDGKIQNAMAAESTARSQAILQEAANRASGIQTLQSQINLLSAASTGDLTELLSAVQEEQTARVEADNAEATARLTLAAQTEWDRNLAEIDRYGLQVLNTAEVIRATASIETEQTVRTSQNQALAEQITTLSAAYGDNSAALQTLAKTVAGPDGATAQYTVKTDVNGYVTGFGFSSSSNNGTPTSQFIFKADQFAFGAPGVATVYPFVIQATAVTVNGVEVPAGVYMDAAYIKNGTITTAHIKNATIDAAQVTGKLTANQINADQLNVTNGTFTGQLIGATGTFSGNLAAASGTFTGELQAASGSFGGRLMAGVLDFSALAGYTETRSSPGAYYFTLAADQSRIRYQIIAGGGGGGAGKGGEWNTSSGGGGGGGAGEYKWGTLVLPPGAQIRVIVGSGGAGATSWAAAGGAGTYSSIDYWNGSSWINLEKANPGQGGAGAPVYYQDNQDGVVRGGAGGAGYPAGGAAASGGGGGIFGGNRGSSVGGQGASTVWGSGGGPGYPNIGWGQYGSGFGSGGGGGAGYDAWRNSGADWNKSLFGRGGWGMGGKAVIEFYNPNTVVLRSEYIALTQRVTTIEQRLGIVS